ncbi:hypothetical protein ACW9HQ_52195, partial [Nocardia gipuzkoensis]
TVVAYVRGLLCIARGLTRAAVGHLLDCGRRLAEWDLLNPAHIPWRSHAARQLVLLGEFDRARELAAAELALAHRWNTPVAVGRARRAVALAAADDTTIDALTEAIALLRRGESVTELIGALVDLADLHRRDGHPESARAALNQALDLSAARGAALWADRVTTRLAALS